MAVEELTNPVFSPYVDTLTLFIPNIQLGGLGIFWRFRAGFKSSFARCLVLQRSTYSKWIGVTWKIQSEKKIETASSHPPSGPVLLRLLCFVYSSISVEQSTRSMKMQRFMSPVWWVVLCWSQSILADVFWTVLLAVITNAFYPRE